MSKISRFLPFWVLTLLPTFAYAQGDKNPLPEWRAVLDEILAWDVLDVPFWRILLFFALVFLGLILKNIIVGRVLRRLESVLTRSSTDLDNKAVEFAREPLQWLAFVGMCYVAVLLVQLPDGIERTVVLVLQTLGTVYVAWMLYRVVGVLTIALDRFAQGTESDMDDHLVPLVARVLRVALIAIAIITIIQQWGYDVTSLIAGLGIGGLAIALAAQDTLGNWFGGIMIFTDRPFKIGDAVLSSKFGEGVVEEVGLRSTKIRTFSKTLITVPNKDVASAAVENFSEMPQRRIRAELGLSYSTTPDQMRRILAGIRKVLEDHPAIDHDNILVNFTGYGDSSLTVLINTFTHTTVYQEWMDAREEIFLQIMDLVHAEGSSFAFPSTSLYFENPLDIKKSA